MELTRKLILIIAWTFAFLPIVCLTAYSEDVKRIALPSIPGLTRTDIYCIEPDYTPVACLVMCPGINGSGEYYLTRRDLRAFARHYRIALVGLSFARDQDTLDQNKGYYTASQGSGKLLLNGIDEHIASGIPILLYGFSGGAHFVSIFEEAYPQRVMAWCAYTAAWWQDSQASQDNPPGIVACGKLDDRRFASSFQYFQAGRRLGKPWCWIALDATAHAENDELNKFVEAYFGSILKKASDSSGWFDIKTKQKVDGPSQQQSETAAWLPDNWVAKSWSKLHKP